MLRNEIIKALRLDERGSCSEENDIKRLIELVSAIYGKPYSEIKEDPNDLTELTKEQLATLASILKDASPLMRDSIHDQIVRELAQLLQESYQWVQLGFVLVQDTKNFLCQNQHPKVVRLISIENEDGFSIRIPTTIDDYLASDNHDKSSIRQKNIAFANALRQFGISAAHPNVQCFPDEGEKIVPGRLSMSYISPQQIKDVITKILAAVEFLEGEIEEDVKAELLKRCSQGVSSRNQWVVNPQVQVKEKGWKKNEGHDASIFYDSNRPNLIPRIVLRSESNGNYEMSFILQTKGADEYFSCQEWLLKALRRNGVDERSPCFPRASLRLAFSESAGVILEYLERIFAAVEESEDELGKIKEEIIHFFKQAASLQRDTYSVGENRYLSFGSRPAIERFEQSSQVNSPQPPMPHGP